MEEQRQSVTVTETCVTVAHCLSVIRIWGNSDIVVVKCIGAEWNSGIVVLKCGRTVEQWHIIVQWMGGIGVSSAIELMNSGTAMPKCGGKVSQ